MRHDLMHVLNNPLKFVAEKGRHAWADPRSIPAKTLDYAKYDVVRALNKLVDALGLNESVIERALARAMAVPAERFLRFKRAVNLLVSDSQTPATASSSRGPTRAHPGPVGPRLEPDQNRRHYPRQADLRLITTYLVLNHVVLSFSQLICDNVVRSLVIDHPSEGGRPWTTILRSAIF